MNLKSANSRIVIRRITDNGQWLDDDHHLLNASETAAQEKENEEIAISGGLVIREVTYIPIKERSLIT